MEAAVKEEISRLEGIIRRANMAYWGQGDSEISDTEYDRYVERLKALDPNNALVTAVNAPKVQGDKVIHERPMLSLDKIYDTASLFKWVADKARTPDEEFLIQPKYDGISARLEGGVLATRGDGHEGTDITSRLPLVRVRSTKRDGILGELVINTKEFKEVFPSYQTKSGQPFKNPRNAVAGIMGCDDVAFYARQGLKVELVDYDNFSYRVKASEFQAEWPKAYEAITGLYFPMDGIVVKLADPSYSAGLGCTEHHPRGQVAFKFANKTRTTRILDIEFSQGKESISAVAVCEPVEFEGVTVSRVRIPMTKPLDRDLPWVMGGGIGIGDTIEIERSGDVIPTPVSITPAADHRVVTLEKCPWCGGEIEVGDTAVRCKNPDCQEKALRKLAFSLDSVGFIGIGEAMLRAIMQHTGAADLCDFMRLTQPQIEASGVGPGNAANIYAEKERCRREATPAQILTALNCPRLGTTVSKKLLERYSLAQVIEETPAELENVDGIGGVIAASIAEGMQKSRARYMETVREFTAIDPYQAAVVKFAPAVRGTVCFTGKVSRPRSEMERIAEEKGFHAVDSVGKGLAYLVCGEKAGSKLAKAQKLGIPVITEEQFYAL